MLWREPGVLTGRHVRLEPAGPEHVDALWAVAQHPEIWRFMPFTLQTRADMASLVHYGRAVGCSFATFDRASGEVVGGTAFLAPDAGNRRVEIGATWVTPPRQRSAVNTEAKVLQLRFAFETLECARVEFKTDVRNVRSRAALLRIGATEEGVFRKHMLMPDGVWRDSVWFSIIDTEWPDVRSHLRSLLAK
jgi:RimJ/RimL family protein N-acetyltransferase